MTNSVKSLDASMIEGLATQIRGEIVLPGDSKYDETREVYNAMIDKHPGAIVKCVDVADVIHSVNPFVEAGTMEEDWAYVMMDW